MDLLNDYADSDGSADDSVTIKPLTVSLAPPVPDEPPTPPHHQLALASEQKPTTNWNPAGDAHVFRMNDATFRREEHAFGRTGVCKDPDTQRPHKAQTIYAVAPESSEHQLRVAELNAKKKRHEQKPPTPTSPTPKRARHSKDATPTIVVPTSKLYLRDTDDYQGRSWLSPPVGARKFEQLESSYTSYIPKRCVHEFKSTHKGGASCVRFVPHYGHLLLSGGLEGETKIWDVGEKRRCIRRYSGHAKGVRDVAFAPHDGHTFLSASYDRSILLWDAEAGRVVSSFDARAIPYCVRFNPTNPNEFLAACANKTVLQYDVRDANNTVQTYDSHMGAVNSLAFVDDARRFVSSSDDKVLRVWDYGIPIVIKYVSDPKQHSMPVIRPHPNRNWLACQSMDNQISVLSIRDRFKMNNKKSFRGHNVAGYACGLTFSPDGRFLGSADSSGKLHFWDWKTARSFRTLQAHKGVCIDVSWHPTRTSFVASAGWDGDIKLWD